MLQNRVRLRSRMRFNFMKTFVLFLLLFFVVPCAAQEKCSLTLKDAPQFFGLSLEMSPKQVQSVFGKKLKLKIKKEGSFFQNFIDKPPPDFLPGVRAVYLRFFERRLYQIEIFYQSEASEQNLDKFVADLSAKSNLPRNLWTTEYGKARLDCGDFSIAADNVLNLRAELSDEITRARFEAKQKSKDK